MLTSGMVSIAGAKSRQDIREIAASLREPLERAGAEQAIVFGSYARGTADAFSDLDLVVVLETDLPRLERHRILDELFRASPVALDLLVYTPAEFAAGMRTGYDVFDAIRRDGTTIYERCRETV